MAPVGSAGLRLRAELRRRWRSWVLIALLAAVLWGGALVALAGARRTETAYERFVSATEGFDVLVTNGSTPDIFNRQFDFDEVAGLPQVADAAPVSYYFPSGESPTGQALASTDITPFAGTDGRFGTELNRAQVLEGRLPEAEDELAVTFFAADRFDLAVGDTMPLTLSGPEALTSGSRPASPTRFRVVGRVAIQGGFPPLSTSGSVPPLILVSSAYARAHPNAAEVLAVRLRRGRSDVSAFTGELERLSGGTQVVSLVEREQTSAVQRGLDVQATVLRLLAGVLAAVALVVTSQSLSRQAVLESTEHPVLRALGVTSAERRTLGLIRAAARRDGHGSRRSGHRDRHVTAHAGRGARKAEPDPGVEVNVALLGVGALAVVLFVLVVGVVTAGRVARTAGSSPSGRPSRAVAALARWQAPPTVLSGVRMALEPGRGRTAVPVRSTVVGTAVGVAAIAGMLVFTGSIGRLFDRPVLYGWNWDVQIGSAFSPGLADVAEDLAADPAVVDTALAGQSRLQIDRLRVDTLGLDPLGGDIRPTVVEGRAPQGPDEILLGTRTLRELDRSIGDSVEVGFGSRRTPLRIVGRGVLSEFAGGARLGEGASMTLDGLRRLVPDAPANFVFLRVRPTDRDTFVSELDGTYTEEGVYLPEAPGPHRPRAGRGRATPRRQPPGHRRTGHAHRDARHVGPPPSQRPRRAPRRRLRPQPGHGHGRVAIHDARGPGRRRRHPRRHRRRSTRMGRVRRVASACHPTRWYPLTATLLLVPALLVLANLIAVGLGLLAARTRPGEALPRSRAADVGRTSATGTPPPHHRAPPRSAHVRSEGASDMSKDISRRTVLIGGGVGLAAVLAGCRTGRWTRRRRPRRPRPRRPPSTVPAAPAVTEPVSVGELRAGRHRGHEDAVADHGKHPERAPRHAAAQRSEPDRSRSPRRTTGSSATGWCMPSSCGGGQASYRNRFVRTDSPPRLSARVRDRRPTPRARGRGESRPDGHRLARRQDPGVVRAIAAYRDQHQGGDDRALRLRRRAPLADDGPSEDRPADRRDAVLRSRPPRADLPALPRRRSERQARPAPRTSRCRAR